MANLDTNVWVTQQALADERNIPVQNVHNWVRRGKIDFKKLPGSRIRLVNKNTITVDPEHHKSR
jgi:hypothetical protein